MKQQVQFDPKTFAEELYQRVPVSQVPEWDEANALMSLTYEMNRAELSAEQGAAVLCYLGITAEEIPGMVEEGFAARDEAHGLLYDEE